MISYDEFSKVRLSDFIENEIVTYEIPEWEWMNCLWYSQQFGFSWTGQLQSEKDKTGAMQLDLEQLNKMVVVAIFSRLSLPNIFKMNEKEIENLFGIPSDTVQFIKDRISKIYIIGANEKYYLS